MEQDRDAQQPAAGRAAAPPDTSGEAAEASGSGASTTPAAVHVDCAACPVAGDACADCVVSVLLGPPQLDQESAAAIAVLSDRGLVPPLRYRRSGSRRVG